MASNSGSSTERLVVPVPADSAVAVDDAQQSADGVGETNTAYREDSVAEESRAAARRPRRKRHPAADRRRLASGLHDSDSDSASEDSDRPAPSSEAASSTAPMPKKRRKQQRREAQPRREIAASAPANLPDASSGGDAESIRAELTREDSLQLDMDAGDDDGTPTPTQHSPQIV